MRKRVRNIQVTAGIVLFLVLFSLIWKNRVLSLREGDRKEERITVSRNGKLLDMDLEDYICAVTARQVNLDWPREAIKAQIVLVRTNLYSFWQDHPGSLLPFSFSDQKTLAENGEEAYLRELARETQGEILTFKGQYVSLPFHAVSNGETRNGTVLGSKYEWLTAVETLQDMEAENYLKIQYLTQKQMREEIQREYPYALTEKPLLSQIQILQRDESDYVTKIAVGNQQISGEKFRNLLHLFSSSFLLEEVDEKIRITTKGVGHGLGMSQYGACGMAKEGKNYRQILHFYFEKLTFEKPS